MEYDPLTGAEKERLDHLESRHQQLMEYSNRSFTGRIYFAGATATAAAVEVLDFTGALSSDVDIVKWGGALVALGIYNEGSRIVFKRKAEKRASEAREILAHKFIAAPEWAEPAE